MSPINKIRSLLPIWLPYFVVVLITLLTITLRLNFGFELDADAVLAIFILPILLSAYLGGVGPGLLATFLAAVAAEYFLLAPLNSFLIESNFDKLQWIILIVAGICISLGSEALRRQNQTARQRAQLLDLASDAIFVRDLNSRIIYWNQGAEKIYGWTRDQALGNPTDSLLKTKFPEPQADVLAQVIQTGHWQGELVHTRVDGSRITVDSRWSLQKDDRGRPVAILEINNNVTERKRAEAAVHELEHFSHATLDALSAHLAILDETGKILVVNQAWRNFAQANHPDPASVCEGANYFDVCKSAQGSNSDEAATVAAALLAAIQGQPIEFSLEYPCHSPTEQRWFIVRITRFAEAGQPRVVVIHENITARVRAEQTLRESQQLFTNIFHSSPTAVALSHLPDGKLVEANPEFLKMTGFTLEEVIGHSAVELGIVADAPGRAARIAAVEQGQTIANFEAEVIQKSGRSRSALVSASIISVNGEHFALTNFLDITERKQAEAQLLYQARLLENISDAVIATDMEFNITSWNRGAERLYGWQASEVIGQPSPNFVTYSDPDFDPSLIRQQILGQGSWTGELVQKHRDGTEINVLVSASIITDSQGRPIGRITVNRDITERKQAESRIIYQASLLDNVSDAIIATDPQFNITSWNRGAEALYGWSSAEVIGQPATAILQTTYAANNSDSARQQLQSHGSWKGEVIQRRKDGSLLDVLASVTIIRNSAGKPTGAVTVNRDITDRKHAEATLAAQTARLALLAEASRTFAVAGIDNRVVLETVAHLTGEYLGAGCIVRLLSPDGQWLETVTLYDPDPAVQAIAQSQFGQDRVSVNDPTPATLVIRTGQPIIIPVTDSANTKADLEPELQSALNRFQPHSIMGTPLRVQDRIIGSLGFWRYHPQQPSFTPDDLTLAQDLAGRAALTITNVRLFEQVQQANVELEQRVTERTAELVEARNSADRANAAKSEFLSRMSHELRTPLNAILGFAQLMEMDANGPRQKDGVDQILNAGRHLLDLINEVLDLSRIESGKLSISPEPVLVSEVVAETLALLHNQANARHIALRPGAHCAHHVKADRQRFKQVLLNLINNAIKYNRDGGEIALECEERPEARLRISVRDTGPGIAPEKLAHLFVPFERLGAENSAIEGTGLGLALSLRLVEAMQGTIGVESQLGQGSTFWIELPLAQSPAGETLQNIDVKSVTADVTIGLRHTVLYIEDNASNLQLIRAILQYRPAIQLIDAVTGQEGLALAQAQRPDLILLDLNLPDTDGLYILRRLQAEPALRAIPVVFISADVTPHQSERLLAAGAQAFLAKPIDVPELLKLLDTLLQ